ncbi:class I SAM-dependent methyltransferase [Paraburkholderia sacchari]|uniref:class I SAM-dependent methyltransferase n=1 Tax=Paraburkholderia sacchari TaxID=159450 RepID=UPI000541B19A|nr:class I SAM-dependent methyltransferase [Paraburkholderia sacchari]NLP62075.1 class I SAM-dependent methyltransferase [Paraburkholderia sacchari]
MQLHDPYCSDIRDEIAVLKDVLEPLHAQGQLRNVLEIGCGTGDMTRRIADAWPDTKVCALEVDTIQLEKNQQRNRHDNITFLGGPAEHIPFGARIFDAVLMFKSLHHVPGALLDQALNEIHRVLRPGGVAYFAEPVFAGELNEIIRLFHDEEIVRQAAFEALVRASDDSRWDCAREVHYRVPVQFLDFEDFERKVMRVTHSDFQLTPERIKEVRCAFEPHMTNHGAHFGRPMRANTFVKALSRELS